MQELLVSLLTINKIIFLKNLLFTRLDEGKIKIRNWSEWDEVDYLEGIRDLTLGCSTNS